MAKVLASLAKGAMTTWLTRAGMRNLHLGRIQLNERRTTLQNKGHEVWLWHALDARTKLIAAAQIEPSTQATAHALIHTVAQVLAPGCIPLFTRDGFNLYFYSLTAHFGTWVRNHEYKET